MDIIKSMVILSFLFQKYPEKNEKNRRFAHQ